MTHNCYTCKHRGEVHGSAHSSCKALEEHAEFYLMWYIQQVEGQTENLKLNPHGILNGWAFWPVDFDPCWVDHCNFYESNETK